MSNRKKFDANDPFDAIAQMTKTAIATAFGEVMAKAPAISSDPEIQYEALAIGLLVGACGCAIAMTAPGGHGELRAALLAHLPDAFDQARDIVDLPPLGRPS
ncbi:hypothetical protein [Mesorhizobium sp. M2A.F.Ca.ET.067.02.1.1]|uniref:hypothetical protein n=1 Tax=Mesorhizobium sp. M2A.F.Ca.ET.067.02.1.1 TaxID=2496749 RepID=UPI000FD272B1|nr:hypothetical protein [Mesorhizobium sp. M2A.F.Ca.ET.067.02.1.1]RUW69837.1 hypothetical protein EOA28_24815 [Mesorhizobium sp. M2A.F.Ca.ET.067.02.1.1]